jgi:phage shock protein PspC (stress-responsive transcriptional regulator)
MGRQVVMLEVKCPKCEAKTGGLAGDYIQWRSDRRKCPYCGVELEISNGIFCFGFCGLIFGVLLALSNIWGFEHVWLRLVVLVLLCWAIMPIVVRVFGRWRVITGVGRASSEARKWAGVAHISRWVFSVAFIVTAVSMGLQYRALLSGLGDIDSGVYATEEYLAAVKLSLAAGLGITGIAFVVYIFALIMRKRAVTSDRERDI